MMQVIALWAETAAVPPLPGSAREDNIGSGFPPWQAQVKNYGGRAMERLLFVGLGSGLPMTMWGAGSPPADNGPHLWGGQGVGLGQMAESHGRASCHRAPPAQSTFCLGNGSTRKVAAMPRSSGALLTCPMRRRVAKKTSQCPTVPGRKPASVTCLRLVTFPGLSIVYKQSWTRQ